MGRHSMVGSEAQWTLSDGRVLGAARYIGRVGALAVAVGIGAAVASGTAIAAADDTTGSDPGANSGGQPPAADSPTAAGDNKKQGTPGSSKILQRNWADAPGGTLHRDGRSRTTTAGAATPGQKRASAAAADDGLAARAENLGRLPDRLAASLRDLVPTGTDAPRDGDTSETAPQDDVVGSRNRHSNAVEVTTRARGLVEDATTAVQQPRQGIVGKVTLDNAAAVIATADSVLNRPTAETISPTAIFTPQKTAEPPAGPVARVVSTLLGAVGITSSSGAGTGDLPVAPNAVVLGALELIRREMEQNSFKDASLAAPGTVAQRSLTESAAAATTVAVVPQPGDVASTPYGDIGKWMLKSNGQISNWGGQTYNGSPVYEPVNVIIIDPTSTSPAESAKKLNRAMAIAGFPAKSPHSTGYHAIINGVNYSQQPTGFLQAYVDDQSDHGRMFGPAPGPGGQGYVWTGAFSTETSSHGYQSFDTARDELADRLVASGVATRVDDVDMGNAGVTGDHDGRAVVLVLSSEMPNRAPTATVTQNKPSASTGVVTGKVTGVDPDNDKMTYTSGTSTTAKGTVTVTSTGSFTYTPTAAARHAAAATNASPADKTDTFNVTVTDEYGAVTTVPVTVPVAPKNTAPSASAVVNKPDPVGGTVTGSVPATDADGDSVTYSATNPASGTVTMNPDGTFTYNPTDAARQRARTTWGTDTDKFNVTVDDGHGGVKTVAVTTTIAPSDQAPVGGAYNLGAPATTNGAVKGSWTATDPDNDPITYSGSTKTAKGTVSVASNGTFTYTPTAAARQAAATENGDKTDKFTLTATDKYGATTTTEVTVPILPA